MSAARASISLGFTFRTLRSESASLFSWMVWMVIFHSFRRSRCLRPAALTRSEEHTSELQSLMRISYAVFCLKKKKKSIQYKHKHTHINITKQLYTCNEYINIL